MINKLWKNIKRPFISLRIRFLIVFAIAITIGVSLYFLVNIMANMYINNVYVKEENKKEREREYLVSLQDFITENEISSEHTGLISEWAQSNRYVYLLIYKDNEIFFTSDDVTKPDDPGDSDTPDTPDDPSADDPSAPDSSDSSEEKNEDGNDGPGGVTIDYPSREELLEYAKKNEMHVIDLADGPLFASFAEFTEYLYYDIANIACLIFAALSVAVIMMLYIQRVTGRLIRLGNAVNKVAEGDTDSRITASGKDEITELAENVELMRSSIVENYKNEKAALDANNALITSMSHDIRTPLTILLGYMDIMRAHSSEDAQMQEYIRAAESTAMRLKKLSDDMFGYFLVFGNKEIEPELDTYDAEMLIEQMLSEHVLLMKENGYKLNLNDLNMLSLIGKTVTTDAQSLVRIFDNAFSNIYKYADKQEEIKISLTTTPCDVIIDFSNKIRNDGEQVESNGIGLKTCKKLAELMGAGFEYGGDDDFYTLTLTLKHNG